MEGYLAMRDEYRARQGRAPKWGGSYGGLGAKLMRRRKGVEEMAVIQRLMYDKRWEWRKGDYGGGVHECAWCGGGDGGRGHILFECAHGDLKAARGKWEESVWKHIGKMGKDWRRSVVEDAAGAVFRGRNDMLACGVVSRNWGEGKEWAGKLVDKGKMRVVEEGLKVLFAGARDLLLMRRKDGGAEGNLVQTKITDFFGGVGKRKREKDKGRPEVEAGSKGEEPKRKAEGEGGGGAKELNRVVKERVSGAMGRLKGVAGAGGVYWEFKAG
jgi:hypothetical protein